MASPYTRQKPYRLRNGLYIWTNKSFDGEFKVGDLVMGYVTKRVGKITAIGEQRFLWARTENYGEPYEFSKESVAKKTAQTGWAKVDKVSDEREVKVEPKYKNPVCRGCWQLGNNCGTCERCLETRPPTQQSKAEIVWAKALKNFGEHAQMRQLQEECGELIVAVSKYFRASGADQAMVATENLAEEIADVLIMCEQMKFVLGEKIQNKLLQKTLRLEARLNGLMP